MNSQRKTGLLLIGLAYLGFVSIGLPDGLNGVAWPSIRADFGLPIDALGALLVMTTSGYLVSSFSSGRLLSHMGVGTLLALSCAATAASLLGYALAPAWWVMLAFGVLAGLGAGAIDAGLNTYAATHFSARMVNWLHAWYGIGALSGPLLMTGLLERGHRWQAGCALVGLAQMALALCFGLTRRRWSNDDAVVAPREAAEAARAVSIFTTLRLPVMWVSVAIFFVYTGLEAAAGAWAYSLLTQARAVPMMVAGAWVSMYWGGLTAGRIVSALMAGRVPVRAWLRGCIIGQVVGAALLWADFSGLSSFLGLALIGVASGPVFPSLIATTPARLGERHTANGVGFQIAAAVLGQSLLPALAGVLARQFGLEIIGPALLAAAVALLALHEALPVATSVLTRTAPITSR
ncbi:MAG TPA: MFS transporter [Blastocatellia bacterium]|nr:MFS transporter [Blastocatellia bacterium]